MDATIKVGIIGDFDEKRSSHLATNEVLSHCAKKLSMNIAISWLPTKSLENVSKENLSVFDAFWCSPGSPYISYTGAVNGIRFARENNYPFIGTCGGFQHAVMEYAQNVLGITEIYHAEYNPDASSFFIAPLSCSLPGETKTIYLKKDTVTRKIYEKEKITEMYNCSFGLNPSCQDIFDLSGFHIAGTDENGEVRIFELPGNRFYIATLFQPQLSSTKENPHILILEFLLAAKKFRQER